MAAAPGLPAPPRLGVVTGLASEAAVLSLLLGDSDPRVRVVCAAARSDRAARLARQLVGEGVAALLSFGIAGALSPELESGDLVIATSLRDPDGSDLPTDPDWQDALSAGMTELDLPHWQGAILGSRRTLREAADKQRAYRDSGCLAVDMESAAVAAVAAEAGLPFLAVRAVADRAGDRLPAFVETAVKPDGTAAIGRVLMALARRPGDIPATLRLAKQTERALASLRRLTAVKEALLGGF